MFWAIKFLYNINMYEVAPCAGHKARYWYDF